MKKQKLSDPVPVRLLSEEKEILKKFAKAVGLSLSTLIRLSTFSWMKSVNNELYVQCQNEVMQHDLPSNG